MTTKPTEQENLAIEIARYVFNNSEKKEDDVQDVYRVIKDSPEEGSLEVSLRVISGLTIDVLLLDHTLMKSARASSILKISLKQGQKEFYGSEAGFNEEFMLLGISGEPVEEKCNYSRIRLKYTVKCSFDKDEKARAREHMAKAQKLYNNLLERTHKILYNP